MLSSISSVVVVAPHPDDETLGAGGTIARLTSLGINVFVLIVSGHLPPLYPPDHFARTKKEAHEAMEVLGVKETKFLEIPATLVSSLPVAELNSAIANFISNFEPQMVLIPFPDRHIDHRVIFDSSMVACRPTSALSPKIVLAYETLSETHWNAPGIEPIFAPEIFFDISDHINQKEKALSCYKSQISENPSRSVAAALSLASFRGSQNRSKFSEAFKVIRILV